MSAGPAGRARFFAGVGRVRDYLLTFATEFAILAGSLLVFKLAALRWDTAGFGAYVLARRTISMLQLPLLLGMAVAVTRYVSMASTGVGNQPRGTYFAAALGLVGLALAAVAIGLNLFAPAVAFLLFGDRAYASLVRALSLAVSGVVLHGVTYGELRGRVAMPAANALQGINLGVVPAVALLVPGLSVVGVVALTGGAWCAITGVTCAVIVRRVEHQPDARALRAAAAELLRYGAPRVPGDLALGALFTLPATVAAHRGGIEAAGFVGLAMSLLSMIGSLFAPIGHILLPAVSRMAAMGDVGGIRRDTHRLLAAALGLTALMVLGLEILAGPLLELYLGTQFAPAVPVVRLVMLAAFPHVAYVILRNVLDAVHVRPYNAKNLLLALATFGAVSVAPIAAGAAVPVAVVSGLAILGVLTVRDTLRVLREAALRGPAALGLTLDGRSPVAGGGTEDLVG